MKNKSSHYLERMPEVLSKIIFYLPRADKMTIKTMPELRQGLTQNEEDLKTMYVKAKALLEDDEDLKAAAALVTAYQKLLSRRFPNPTCQSLSQRKVTKQSKRRVKLFARLSMRLQSKFNQTVW